MGRKREFPKRESAKSSLALVAAVGTLFFSQVLFAQEPPAPDSGYEKTGKNWKVKITSAYAYDDNAVANPQDDSFRPFGANNIGSGDSLFQWTGYGYLDHALSENLKLRGTYAVDQTLYAQKSPLDMTLQIFGISPAYQFSRALRFGFDYKFIHSTSNRKAFSGSHVISPSVAYLNPEFGMTRFSLESQLTDNWRNDARDQNKYGLGISHTYLFQESDSSLGFAYDFSVENADKSRGSAFDRNTHRVSLRGETWLPYEVLLDSAYDFSHIQYDSRIGSGSSFRQDNRQDLSLRLSKVLFAKWKTLEDFTVEMKYRHTSNISTLNERSYKSNRYDAGFKVFF